MKRLARCILLASAGVATGCWDLSYLPGGDGGDDATTAGVGGAPTTASSADGSTTTTTSVAGPGTGGASTSATGGGGAGGAGSGGSDCGPLDTDANCGACGIDCGVGSSCVDVDAGQAVAMRCTATGPMLASGRIAAEGGYLHLLAEAGVGDVVSRYDAEDPEADQPKTMACASVDGVACTTTIPQGGLISREGVAYLSSQINGIHTCAVGAPCVLHPSTADPAYRANGMALVDATLYFVTPFVDPPRLFSLRLDGLDDGPKSVAPSDFGARELVTDDVWLVWNTWGPNEENDPSGLWAHRIGDGDDLVAVQPGNEEFGSIAAFGGDFYVRYLQGVHHVRPEADAGTGTLTVDVVYDRSAAGTAGREFGRLLADRSYLYLDLQVGDAWQILRCPREPVEPAIPVDAPDNGCDVLDETDARVESAATDGRWIFWANADGVFRVRSANP